jgi:hypothetical protein
MQTRKLENLLNTFPKTIKLIVFKKDPGSKEGWGKRNGARGSGEKWPKQCMYIYIHE